MTNPWSVSDGCEPCDPQLDCNLVNVPIKIGHEQIIDLQKHAEASGDKAAIEALKEVVDTDPEIHGSPEHHVDPNEDETQEGSHEPPELAKPNELEELEKTATDEKPAAEEKEEAGEKPAEEKADPVVAEVKATETPEAKPSCDSVKATETPEAKPSC